MPLRHTGWAKAPERRRLELSQGLGSWPGRGCGRSWDQTLVPGPESGAGIGDEVRAGTWAGAVAGFGTRAGAVTGVKGPEPGRGSSRS